MLWWLAEIAGWLLLAFVALWLIHWGIALSFSRYSTLSTGIVPVIGKPGSGKSYWAVRQMTRICCQRQDRLIYTNLPIKWRALRAFLHLRGLSPREAGRVRKLTRDHFKRFCERLDWIDQRAERYKDETGCEEDEAREYAFTVVLEELGPHVTEGAKANWFPAGSIFFLDEIHKWFGSKQADYKQEPRSLLAFTSMHRHRQHLIYIISQRAMNISNTWRSMATHYLYCEDMSRVPVILGLSIPVKLLTALKYFAGDLDNSLEPMPGKRATAAFRSIPALEGFVTYRLYRSHTHGGSQAEMDRERRRELERAGVVPPASALNDERVKKMRTRRGRLLRVGGWIIRQGVTLGWVVVLIGIGRCSVPSLSPSSWVATNQDVGGSRGGARAGDGDGGADQAAAAVTKLGKPALPSGKVEGLSDRYVLIDGEAYGKGDRYGEWLLVAVDIERGASCFVHEREAVWVYWAVGGQPRYWLPDNELRFRLRELGRGDTSSGAAGS